MVYDMSPDKNMLDVLALCKGVSQIAYFCTEYLIFWWSKRVHV